MKNFLCFLLLMISTTILSAQDTLTISGRISDAVTGEVLIGATILIRGTSKGVITDFNGEFTYILQEENIPSTVLEVTYLGMKTRYIKVGNKRYFDIKMQEDLQELEEVIITSSYGTEKLKQEVVGSVSQVNVAELNTFEAVESVDKLLEGQIAGVQISGSPELGSPVKIDIRGQGTLTSITGSLVGTSSQPLIIVDGIVMGEESGIDNELFDGGGLFGENFQNPLARLSPDDIASFTILKDAAAVSLYGADGANGVILITTKKAENRRLTINFSSQVGINKAKNRIKYLSGPQYHELFSEYLKNSGISGNAGSSDIDTDWFDLLNRNGLFTRTSLNLGQSFGDWFFRLSSTYQHNKESQIGNNFESLNGQIKIGINKKKYRLDVTLLPSYNKKESPNTAFNFPFPPNISPFNEDGSLALLGLPGRGNPLAEIEQNRNNNRNIGVLGSVNISYNFNKDWSISSQFSLDKSDKNQDRYFSGDNGSGRTTRTFILDGITYPRWGVRLKRNRNLQKWFWRLQSIYKKEWKESHKFDMLLGIEANEEITDLQRQFARGFTNPGPVNEISDAIQDDDPATQEDESLDLQSTNEDILERAGVSFYSQVNYSLHDKYFLLINFRQDRSSAFGKNVNVAYNGGMGFSWNLTSEPWFEDIKWLDFLRWKISYGSTGNSRIGSFRSQGLYRIDPDGYFDNPTAIPSSAPNPNLGWERNYKFNTGIEINVLERYRFLVEVYNDNLQDLIIARDLPRESGYSSVQINGATMYNRGIELTFSADWFKNESIRWNTSFNLSKNINSVTNLVGLGSDFSSAELARAQQIGFSTSTIWGINGGFVDPATGRFLFYQNGELYDEASYDDLFNKENWEPIGDSQPDFVGGFRNRWTFWNKLSLMVTGSIAWGHQTLIADELESQYRIIINRNLSVNTLDYWQKPGDLATQPKVVSNFPVFPNSSNYLHNLSHINLRNINLAYNFDLKSAKFGLRSARLFFDISNAYIWYKESSREDRNGIREYRFNYPEMRTFTLGTKLEW